MKMEEGLKHSFYPTHITFEYLSCLAQSILALFRLLCKNVILESLLAHDLSSRAYLESLSCT